MNSEQTWRFTFTVTPLTDAEAQAVVDDMRARFGRKPLIHVIGRQPSETPVSEAVNPDKHATEVTGLRAFINRVTADRDWHADEGERLRQEHHDMETRLALLVDRVGELVMSAGGPAPEDVEDALSILARMVSASASREGVTR